MSESLSRLLTPAEVADVLGMTGPGLKRWRYEGRGPCYVVVGRRLVRYRRQDVLDWIESQKRGGPDGDRAA